MGHFRETIPQLFATHSQGKASQSRHITRKRDQLLHNEIERKRERERERQKKREHPTGTIFIIIVTNQLIIFGYTLSRPA